jgi:5,10-methylenetetrahydrofolate reductase
MLSGDFVSLGDHPDAKPVYDADSVQLLQMARGLMAGQDSAGLPLKGAPRFCLGAVVIPEAEPLAPQMLKVRKKVAAGVDFLVTAPIYDLQKLAQFRQHLADQNIKLLACVKVPKHGEVEEAAQGRLRKVYSLPAALVQELSDPDPEACLQKGAALAGRLVKEIRDQKLADCVYLKDRGRADHKTVILDKAGV